jgi:translation initiation factor IF-2
MIPKTFLTLALLALAPLSLQAQRPESAAQRIEAARARAARAGIPVELLESRVTEGRAKGVPEERIADAVERRVAGLARAQEAMGRAGGKPSAAELSAGADALEAGADGRSLRAVSDAARAEDRPVALAVLGELVKQGLPVEQARARVLAALDRRGEALARLPEQAARERGGRPEGVGRPSGVGGRPSGVGGKPSGVPGGPPAGVPGAGQRPGTPGGKPAGTPGGKPTGRPGGRP